MPYTKTIWSTGDVITASLANHFETQYDEAVAYTDSKVYQYPDNAYKGSDDASVYNPKPPIAVMDVATPDDTFPFQNGALTSYWTNEQRGFQVYSGSDKNYYFREVHPAIYPAWSDWRKLWNSRNLNVTDNGSGIISMPQQSYVRLHHPFGGSYETVIPASTTQTLNIASVADNQAEYSAGRFTAKESGLYNVSAWFTDGSTYTGKACRYYLSCSDGRPRPIVTPEDFGSGINTPTMQKGDVSVWLNAGDYFDIKVQTSSSGPASIDESEVIIAKIQ